MGLIQKAFGDIITFSRSSNATRVGPDGLVQYAPHNLLVYSEMFADASWVKTSATVTANILAAPNGTVTGDLIESTGAGGRAVQTVSAPSTSVYTYSVYLKKKDTTTVELLCRNNTASVNYAARFDLDTLATSNVSAGATALVVDVGNGWRRCTIITASITSGNSILCYVYGGIGTSGENVYAWGAQLSVGSVPGDYTPTTTAAVYGPRFDFDGSGVTIVDPIATNLLTYSEQFDNAAWTKSASTISANVIAAPDGTVTADKLVEDTTTTVHDCRQSVVKAASQINYAATFYAKAAERTFVRAYLYSGASADRIDTTVNLSNGTVSYVTSNGTWTAGACSVLAIGNGWYRIAITGLSNTATSVRLLIATSTGPASGDSNYTGDGTSGIYIWGAQLEVGSTATGYMPSGATNGFRAVPVVTGSATARGLLVEEQRTNIYTYSEDFSNANWLKTNLSVTADVVLAPDGSTTADKLVENTATASRYILTSTSMVIGTAYAVSVFAKAAERNQLFVNEAGTNQAVFDVAAGTVVSASGCTATITAFPNGWFKCTWSKTAAFAASPRIGILVAGGTYTGNGTSGLYIWGAQFEAGSFATSYIPTVASTVTRSADVATINTLSPFFNATEGTMFAQFDSAASGTNTIAAFDDNTANENYRLRNVGTDPKFTVTDGGVDQCDINGGTIAANTVYNFAAAYKANDFAVCIAGGTVQTDTSGTLPTVDRLRIGTSQAGNYLNGHVRRFAYYPRRLANAELQALTA